jgi:hypothetical protein
MMKTIADAFELFQQAEEAKRFGYHTKADRLMSKCDKVMDVVFKSEAFAEMKKSVRETGK